MFVLVPAIIPIVFGGTRGRSAGLIAVNVGLVVLSYVVTSFGVIPLIGWATGRLLRQLTQTLTLFARAMPLLLLFVTFLFINAEVWQVSANLFGPLLWGTIGLFVAFGTLFIVVRLPSEVDGLGTFSSWRKVSSMCTDTPMQALAEDWEGRPRPRSLERLEWANVGLVILIGQALQVLLVAGLVGAFLVLLGLLLMPSDVIATWTQMEPTSVWSSFGLLGRDVQLTEELLRVAVFLASFSGLYFAVTAVTDITYRQEFFEEVVGEVGKPLQSELSISS